MLLTRLLGNGEKIRTEKGASQNSDPLCHVCASLPERKMQ